MRKQNSTLIKFCLIIDIRCVYHFYFKEFKLKNIIEK